MKEFKLNPNSLHFKLATLGDTQGDKHWLMNSGTDICAYTRMVIGGAFKMLLVLAVLGGLITLAGFCLYDIVMTLFFGAELGKAGFAFSVLFCGAFIGFGHVLWQQRKESIRNGEVTPTFVGLAYRKFKDKTCFKVNFK